MSIDPQNQLDTATAFFLAGERCAVELRFGQYGFHTVSAPTIVNYALSVELALKLIHLLALGAPARGHNLEDLYRALPDDTRAISNTLQSAWGRSPVISKTGAIRSRRT